MKTNFEIKQIAYAKAYCQHGFRYFFIHGPLTWFFIIYLYGIIIGIIKKQPIEPSRLVIVLFVVVVSAILVAKLSFYIFQRQINKWDKDLTENEINNIQKQMATLKPFFQITAFEILFIAFSSSIRFYLK